MKKSGKNIIFLLLIFVLGVSTAFLIYLHFFASGDGKLSGEWTAELDLTDRAVVTALDWLQDIEAVSVSMEELEASMQGLTVQMHMTMEQTSRSAGTFQCGVLPESYEACSQAAYEAFAAAFRELLTERLHLAGYPDITDGEAVEALVQETFGMSSVSYLMTCGPALLPSLKELQAEYDGSGTYETAEGVLTRRFDADGAEKTESERYIRQGGSLVLLGEADSDAADSHGGRYPAVYTLEQSEN